MSKPNPSRHAPQEIDAYFAPLPANVRAALEQVRAIIREAAPNCTERVSYGIPIFRLRRDLVGLSAQDHHCSLHTMSPALVEALAGEMKDVEVSGATIHFSPEKPLPKALIQKIVRERTAASE